MKNRKFFTAPNVCKLLSLAILLFAFSAIQAQQPTNNVPGNEVGTASSTRIVAARPVETDAANQYRVGPGDLLSIQVFNRAQLSRDERIDSRGMIKMPLIGGEIRAACQTEKELAQVIANLYQEQKLLKNPEVHVSVKDYQSQAVAVLGAVNGPGRFQLQRRIRLLELLVFHAGGPAATAGRSVQVLSTGSGPPCEEVSLETTTDTESEKSENIITTYQLATMLKGEGTSNPYVRPGDIVSVPVAGQVFVVGSVQRPSPLPLTDDLTLTRAIAAVGGTVPGAQKSKIRVTRQALGTTTKTQIYVDLSAIDKRQVEDVILQDGDIVEVPSKMGFGRVLEGLIRTIIPGANHFPVQIIR